MANWALANTAHAKHTPATLPVPLTTIGNVLVYGGSCSQGGDLFPTGGGTWNHIRNQVDAGNSQEIDWWWTVCNAAVNSIAILNAIAAAVVYGEFVPPAGTPTLDVQAAAGGFFVASATPAANASPAITPASPHELILSLVVDQKGKAPNFTAQSPFALAVAEPGTAGADGGAALGYVLDGAAGSQTATWGTDETGAANSSMAVDLIALNPAGTGGSGQATELWLPGPRVVGLH